MSENELNLTELEAAYNKAIYKFENRLDINNEAFLYSIKCDELEKYFRSEVLKYYNNENIEDVFFIRKTETYYYVCSKISTEKFKLNKEQYKQIEKKLQKTEKVKK